MDKDNAPPHIRVQDGLPPEELGRCLEKPIAALNAGNIVVFPTETFYGLAVRADNAAALERLARLKGRTDGKPLPVIASDMDAVRDWGVVSPIEMQIAGEFWPGPLTMTVQARVPIERPNAAADRVSEREWMLIRTHLMPLGTIGVRVSSSPVASALAAGAGGVIVATSANVAGERPATGVELIPDAVLAGVACVVDGGPTPGGAPSTVADLTEAGVMRLYRVGAISMDRLTAFLERTSPNPVVSMLVNYAG